MTDEQRCPYGCDDEMMVWDEAWCGDEEHCAPKVPCPLHSSLAFPKLRDGVAEIEEVRRAH
jgi:hypothetical protein